MNSISPLITIKPKKIETISQYLCDNEEIIYASKVQFNYPPSRNLPAQVGYAILTYGFIYLFTKENKELILQEQIYVFDCLDIKFMDNKGKDSKAAILIKGNSEDNLFTIFNGEKMAVFYDYIVYSISIISNGRSHDFSMPNLNPQIPIKTFAIQFRILKRSLYLIHLDMKNEKIPKSSIDGSNYFKDPKIYFKGQLLINSNFHANNFSEYYGKSIGLEPNITVVVFQDFNEGFTTLFKSIQINSIRIKQIKFNEYKSAPIFSFEKVEKTTIEKYQFANSSFKIIENFLNGCMKCEYDIKNIKINSVEVQQNDLISIFDNLNKLKSLQNLTSFSLVSSKIEFFKPFPFDVFQEFLQNHTNLESLTISDIEVDGSTILEKICDSNSNIYELHLNKLSFDTPINIGDDQNQLKLPHNIVFLDFSHSTFKNLSLSPLLQLITKSDGKSKKIILNMSHLEPKDNTFIKAFKSVDLNKCNSNIIELNWSGNNLSPDFFNFIQSQKNLQFLSLLELNVEKQNGFFQALMKFMVHLKLKGIEIGSNSFDHQFVNPFLDFLKTEQNLENFHFHCQPGQNEIGRKLSELILSLPNLKELFIEAKGMSIDSFIKVANSIINNKSIISCFLNIYEIDRKDQRISEIIPIITKIRKLKFPTTIEQRALLEISNQKIASSDLTTIGQEQSINIHEKDVIEEEEEV